MNKTKENAIVLLTQLIEMAEKQDQEYKNQMFAQKKSERAIGESWLVFHLKTLKELVDQLQNPTS